ncbi:MAG: hypothetical protein K2N44_10660 [Lachnospiraceae bacterium]|nr:hypothetical protein [Lachnospiraceae bacterium]
MQTGNEVERNEVFNIESLRREPAVPDVKSEQEKHALTRAEKEQITAGKRDRLYRSMQILSVVFAVVSIMVMAGFKMNEGFFDASSRIGILMESVNAQEDSLSAPKVNVRTNFKDEAKSRLVIPLMEPIASEDVSVREEFVRNKYVITLSEYSQNVPNGVELVSDSMIMDAVGVYRQNNNVVVEVYCRDLYDYELMISSNTLTVSFKKIEDSYAASAVVWFPYNDRNRLALPEWRQSLDKFAVDNHMKLYMASDMQEEYTQEDVIAFANRIHADMVLGVQVEETSEQQSYMTGICNTTYFIPEYNSAHLSVVMTEAFVEATQIGIRGFEESDDSYTLVAEAIVPSAAVIISLTQKDMESVENEYRLNGKIVEALEKTMSDILQDYIIKFS